MYCQHCGSRLRDGAKYCWNCGQKVEGAPEETASAPPVSPAAITFPVPPAATAAPAPRIVPAFLNATQYEHPDDHRATEYVKVLAPVVAVTRALIGHLGEPRFTAELLGSAVKAGPNQFPRLYGIAEECARILHIAVPDVYVRQNPTYNATTFGVERPFVLLFSALVDSFSDDELRYIIGHEMGHIKSQHTLYLSTFHLLTTQAARLAARYGLGMLAFRAARLALEAWSRSAELSADRAGLICSQEAGTAAKALVKLVLGSQRLAGEVNIDEFLRQTSASSPYGVVNELGETHPLIARRIRELRAFGDSQEYQAILASGVDSEQIAPEARETFAAELLEQSLRQINPGTLSGLLNAVPRDHSGLEKGVRDLHRVLELYPGTDSAVRADFYIAFAAMHLRRAAEAVTRFERFLALHPAHDLVPKTRLYLGSCYLWLLKDKPAAHLQLEQLAGEFPKTPEGKEARRILAEWRD